MTQPERTLEAIRKLEALLLETPNIAKLLIDVIDALPAHVRDRQTDFQLKQIRGRLEQKAEESA